MYGGFEVYKTYLAIKLHFVSKSYDYHKYEGKINCKLDTFTKRNDRYFFHKLSKIYTEQEIVGFFVSNFLNDSKKWVGSLLRNDGRDVYLDYKKRQEAFNYHFRADCLHILDDFNAKRFSFNDGFNVFGGQHPRFLYLLLSKKISFETAIVFEETIGYSKKWSKQIKEQIVWPDILNKLQKYKGFIKYNNTAIRLILKEIFVNGG
jgi:hypothetical protein|tara:strand:+ start:366 stop:980 length:615 start_codon:yes stop_codon:yes gene_type:complete